MTVRARLRTHDSTTARALPPGAWAVARLPLRLVRRGAVLLWLAAAAFTAVEVVSYRQTYPDAASREQLARFSDDPAVRVLQGVPRAVDTVGGFVAWDAGWFLALLVAIWGVLVTTRLLRADEDSERVELVLARPISAVRLLLTQLAVVLGAVLAYGATVTLVLVLMGVAASGAALLGGGLAGVGACAVAVAAAASQLLEPRRRALGAAAGAVALAFLVRMVGSSTAEREWLLLLTPFGWFDRLQPFATDRWSGLLPLVVLPVLLVALAATQRVRRDTGEGRLGGSDRRPPRLRLLGSPAAFGWRSGEGVLAAWVVGVGLFGLVTGSLVSSVVDLFEQDEQYGQVLRELGIDPSSPIEAFLGLMAVTLALAFALHVAWRVGALRAEEAAGRLEHLLVRPVGRARWLATSAALALLATTLVVVSAGAGVWVGAALSDTAVSAAQAFRPVLWTLPVVVLFGGIAVLMFGIVPRMTVALPVGLAVLAYLLDLVGPVLDLPQVVRDLSPFAWLPRPGEEPSATAALVLVLVGLAAAAVGTTGFVRRDLTGE